MLTEEKNRYSGLIINLYPEKNRIAFLYKNYKNLKKVMDVDDKMIIKIIRDYLNKGILNMLQINKDFIYVSNVEGMSLCIRNLSNKKTYLIEEIKEKYFNDRIVYLINSLRKVQSVFLACTYNSKISQFYSQKVNNELTIFYSFLSRKFRLIDIDQKFLDLLLENLLILNRKPLIFTEKFYWNKFDELALENLYSLKIGNINLDYNVFFKNYIDKKISKHQEETGRKLYRVLEGGKMYE